MSFAIVTDSTCDLPKDVASQRRIIVVPQYVIFGTQSYKDGVDISPEEFYSRLQNDKHHPKTSQPTAADFAEAYKSTREAEGVEGVLSVVVSQKVSGTYNSASQAVKMVDFPVEVVDSECASIALGFMALQAADLRDAGKTLAETAEILRSTVRNYGIYFTPATLEYLHRGGRIGGASRFIGEALKIKPILFADHGAIDAKDKVRTAKRALQRLVEIAHEETAGRKIKRLGIFHAYAPDDVAELQKAIADMNAQEMMVVIACSAVGTHAGPGLYGLAWQVE